MTARLTGRPRPPFVRWDPEFRCNPQHWLKGARSVLTGAVSYHSRYSRNPHGKRQGYLSPFAQPPDYHELVGAKLEALGRYIEKIVPEAKYLVQADSGPGCERLYALWSGVGWQGKNNFIIVPGHGSFVWLGLMTTNLELSLDQPLESQCGECARCLEACPTKAYAGPHDFDHTRCIALWASDKRELSQEQRKIMGRHRIIYGCDFCQLACPHNLRGEAEAGNWPDLEALLNMSRAEFEDVFKKSAAGWRGHDVLMRNAVLAAAGTPEFRAVLEKLARGEGMVAENARAVLNDCSSGDA